MSTNFRDIYTQWTQKQALLSFVMKSARCWAGYESVPGKAPYSNDSCRPKGGKKPEAKKKPAAEKQAADPVTQLGKPPTQANRSHSQTPFDSAHARQTLGLPDTAPAHQAYNRMMHMYKNKKFTPAQFSSFNSLYGDRPPQFDDLSPTSPGPAHFEPATSPPRPPAPAPAPASTPQVPRKYPPRP